MRRILVNMHFKWLASVNCQFTGVNQQFTVVNQHLTSVNCRQFYSCKLLLDKCKTASGLQL